MNIKNCYGEEILAHTQENFKPLAGPVMIKSWAGNIFVLGKTQSHVSVSPNQNGKMAKVDCRTKRVFVLKACVLYGSRLTSVHVVGRIAQDSCPLS